MPANDALLGTVEEAMRVELYTIPLYLYALYSIKSVKQGSTDPRKVIRGVRSCKAFLLSVRLIHLIEIVKQEMLHLTLTGNLLTALGGSPKLYSRTGITDVEKQPVPVYPNKIFKTCVVMNLASAIKSQIEFLQLARQIELFELHFPDVYLCGNRSRRQLMMDPLAASESFTEY